MKTIKIFFLTAIISITTGYGQSLIPQVVNTSGGSSQNKGYSLDWSIGELALVNVMNSIDGNYILTNGFIQPLSQGPFPSANIELSSIDVHIFPNPTTDLLVIDFLQTSAGKINVQLFNEAGNIIYRHEIMTSGFGFQEKINTKGFANGIYTLHIKKLNPVSGNYDGGACTYKIIKL
ncbi:MAG: T9SS type A sorting domain-containing protein [Ginsengibacter sp.]